MFPFKKTFVKEILLNLVKKTMNTYVVLTLVDCLSTTCTFDLWMFKGMHDVFVAINFISNDWEAKHVMIGLFEVTDTNDEIMVLKL